MLTDLRSPSPVALTFDDGPDPVWTPLVLDALAAARARATFFVIAPQATRYPSLIAHMRESGHDVAFHCVEHVRHDAMTTGEIEAEVASGLQALGRSVRYWRTPWGIVTPATEEAAMKYRLGLVGWTADTEDWRGGRSEEMLARVRAGISAGAILLMHDGVGPGTARDGCAGTAELIQPLVDLVRAYGLEPTTLGRLQHPLPHGNPHFQAGGAGIERVRGV
jgi:peptidoglycan-N-acetylglucosamine deacetylase